MPDLRENNLRLNRREIKQKKTVLESKPVTLDVTLTSECNLRCRMCCVRKKSWEVSRKTLDEVRELFPYISCTTWQGGEAFLYPGFRRLLDEIHENHNHIVQTIYTNALLIDRNWMEEIIKGPKTLFLSIDSVVPDLYERIRVGASFKTLLENLDLINKYRSGAHHEIKLYINSVIMRSNFREMSGIIDFAAEHGVSKVEFSPVEGDLKEENIFRYPDRESSDFIARMRPELEAMAAEKGVEVFNRLPYEGMLCDKDLRENTGEGLFCTLPWTFLFILAGGLVIPHGSCKKPVGDVNRQGILEIWNGAPMQEYRRRLAEGNFRDWCGENLNWMDII